MARSGSKAIRDIRDAAKTISSARKVSGFNEQRFQSPLKKPTVPNTRTAVNKNKKRGQSSSPLLSLNTFDAPSAKRATEKSMFIKRDGDHRVNCHVEITVNSVKTMDNAADEQRGPFAI